MNNGYLLSAFILVVLLFVACAAEREAVPPTVKPGESFTLAIADSIVIKDGDQRFWVSVVQIEDSRCPKDVNCITGGRATVQLKMEGQAEQKVFCTGPDCFGEQNNNFLVEYNNRSYTIVLEEILPYPESSQTIVARKATFKIKQAN